MPFGYVVDDRGADKVAAGGAGAFALSLAEPGREKALDPAAHLAACPACKAAGEALACVGLVDTPLSQAAEKWLVDRLPDDIESLPGFLLRKAIGDFGYEGEGGRALREKGLLAAPGPYTRHFGPFFRRFTVSSEQLLEELLCAGDVDPAHALAVLVHLGAVEIDGRILLALDEGAKLAEVVAEVEARGRRARFTLAGGDADERSVAALKRYLRALYAGFVVDAPVMIFTG